MITCLISMQNGNLLKKLFEKNMGYLTAVGMMSVLIADPWDLNGVSRCIRLRCYRIHVPCNKLVLKLVKNISAMWSVITLCSYKISITLNFRYIGGTAKL